MVDMDRLKKQFKYRSGTGIIGEQNAVKAAVLIPLIKVSNEWSVLFEVRSLQLKSQPGDICFPGGKIEGQDRTPQDAAVRETAEELGIRKDIIEVLGPLDRYIPNSHFILYPFVGILKQDQFQLSKMEVDEVFTIPLSWLLETQPEKHVVKFQPHPPKGFPYERIAMGEKYEWRPRDVVELFYHYGSHSVWGMTARILQHFLQVIK